MRAGPGKPRQGCRQAAGAARPRGPVGSLAVTSPGGAYRGGWAGQRWLR